VDGAVVSPGTAVTNFLTAGLHALKLRSTNGPVTVTNLTVTEVGAPNPPTLNNITSGNSFAALTWTPAASGPAASGYVVEYGTASGAYTAQVTAGAATNCVVTGLSNGVTLYFAVYATNATGYSLPSDELSATPTPPGQLENLLVWNLYAAGAKTGGNATVESTTTLEGMLVGNLTRGSGNTAANLPAADQNQGAINGHVAVASTLTTAKNSSDYLSFFVTPNSGIGAGVSLSSLSYVGYHGMNDLNATMVLGYQSSGFPSTFTPLVTNTLSGGYQGANTTVSVAGVSALQNLTAAQEFRIYIIDPDTGDDVGLGEQPATTMDLVVSGSVTFPASAPMFSLSAGTYTNSQSVAISSLTPGSAYNYTLDGSTPATNHGTLYIGPVTISSNLTLKAIAYQSGYQPSAVASSSYVIVNTNSAPVILSLARNGANLQLTWPGGGTLLQATNVTGPWITNASATSPYTVTATNSQQFFRIYSP
jgi:hypothetical protein